MSLAVEFGAVMTFYIAFIAVYGLTYRKVIRWLGGIQR